MAPCLMEIWPEARLTMIEGMKKGLTRRWPLLTAVRWVSSNVERPPMPEPTMTPQRSPSGLSMGKPASCSASCAPASANWMKRSLRRASFLSMYSDGSKFFTSPAMRLGNSCASNRVMAPTPLLPASAACHTASTPMPRGVTSPRPVMTTLRSTRAIELLLVLVDEVDSVLHGLDVLGLFVGDFHLELLFHGHHQLDDVERVSAEVLDERALGLDLVFPDSELLRDDALDLRLDGHGPILSLKTLET